MQYQNNIDFAKQLDKNDPLAKYRDKFFFPQHNGQNVIYFTGNSLGLQPKSTRQYLQQELDDWANLGVEAHFKAKNPWYSYHEIFNKSIAKIAGALPGEAVVMNQLTSNLHFLMISFYRPDKKRYKILCEQKAFPSDQYAVESHAKLHGFDPDNAIIEVGPREGEYIIRMEDILSAIDKHKDELALVLFGGVNYFTGQAFDMKAITAAGHKAGAMVGFDLAHAIGNIKLHLHDWNVDFACWCSYKYLNSGPGSVGGAFVHQKHESEFDLPRLAGWWGHDKDTRFKMEKGFNPIKGAEGWQLSNAPVLSMAAHKASVDIFDEVGMDSLVKKSELLTGYLEFIIDSIGSGLEIITPRDKSQRGCHISVIAHGKGKEMFNKLIQNGVIADWREPNAIRCAPVPLYNSFEDVFRFGEILKKVI
jgi:kynureninase